MLFYFMTLEDLDHAGLCIFKHFGVVALFFNFSIESLTCIPREWLLRY